ncbi:hypothetical protein E2C06_30585 [Dankookia rubra]|uniref:DUF4156 domain-containing protein n=1 Tax=Dankookia rubra TaxID=1442381 RepID=A0A4R5Q9H0_9PROT|nr:hypothetical protein [Dankookia rubra]TDH58817.1 hypothetical protein E2C06_30585 [Dankookia rubra]
MAALSMAACNPTHRTSDVGDLRVHVVTLQTGPGWVELQGAIPSHFVTDQMAIKPAIMQTLAREAAAYCKGAFVMNPDRYMDNDWAVQRRYECQ